MSLIHKSTKIVPGEMKFQIQILKIGIEQLQNDFEPICAFPGKMKV